MKRPIGRCTVGAGVFSALLATSALARADYDAPGPETVTTTALPASTDGGATGGDLIVPNGTGPYPLLVTTHGFSGTADNQVGWAQHFASYGFVVVVPSLPNTFSPNEDLDAAIIENLAATYASPPSDSPAFGKVDGTRIGLEGHSAGGLATTMASSVINPMATVLFDPVDNGGVGIGDVPKVCSPLLEIFADSNGCNNNAGWDAANARSKGDQIQFHVVGATHCDGENNVQGICTATCGAASTARQAEFAKYATAFFLAYVKGDSTAKAAITESALGADTALSGSSVTAGTNCDGSSGPPTTSDGGTSTGGGDAGKGSGGGSDGGSSASGDAGGGSGNGDTNGASGGSSSSSSGCAQSATTSDDDRNWAYFIGLSAIGLAFVRRVRKTPAR